MSYLPEVAWSTIASNVTLGASAYRYYITVNPLDPNEAGASPMTVAINDWFIDFAGYPFLIEEVNGSVLTVYDILERGDGVVSAYAPYANKLGYVYRPLNGAIILTQAQLRKLDQSAPDIINTIEKGILWSHRGISALVGDGYIDNITRLRYSSEFELTENIIEESWRGGKVYDINAKVYRLYQPDGTNPFVYTDNNGALHIDGDIIQNGSAYETHAEQVYTKDNTIILRDGAIFGLTVGEYAGFTAKLYDGVNDGQLVFDNTGVARVGDLGSLQPITTRIETPTNGQFAYWEGANLRLNFRTINEMIYPGAGIAVSTGTAWGTSIVDNSANWNTAYGWGDHAGLYAPISTVSSQWITSGSDIYYNTGNVGIGTSTPSYGFESALSTASLGNKALIVGGGNEIWSQPQTNSNAALYINYRGYADGLTQFRDLRIANGKGTTIASFIGASGNVGIGTTAPTNKLDILTTSDNLNIVTSFSNTINRLTALNKGTAITLGYSPSEYFTKIATVYENQNPNYLNPALAFYTMYNTYVGGTEVERMRISSNGNVGIGTTVPGVRFVNSGGRLAAGPTLGSGVIGSDAILSENGLYGLYTGISENGDVWIQSQRNDGKTYTYNILLNPNGGNVGIGTTSPSVKLDVSGTGRFTDKLYLGTTTAPTTDTGTLNSLVWDSSTGEVKQRSISGLPSGTQGDILYYNGTSWVVLHAGTNGYFLKTQGSGANPVWSAVSGGTVTSVAAGNGMNFTTITSSGSVTLGTPSALTSITTNSVTSNSHTHSIEIAHQTSTTSSSTPTPTGNYKENEYYLTALAAGATFAAPSGTPVNGNTLLIRIKDNGTARTLAWNSIYRAVGVTLPTTTTASKTLYIGCIYNSTDSKWDVVSVVEQA